MVRGTEYLFSKSMLAFDSLKNAVYSITDMFVLLLCMNYYYYGIA